jgi:hypothetical protein
MRTAALLLSIVVASSASPARADESPQAVVKQQRGFLSGLGLGLLIGGLAGVGAGIGGLVSANEGQTFLAKYDANPTSAEQPSVNALHERVNQGTVLAAVGFVGGGLALAGGIICLAIDTPSARVAFLPTAQGGVFVVTGRF